MAKVMFLLDRPFMLHNIHSIVPCPYLQFTAAALLLVSVSARQATVVHSVTLTKTSVDIRARVKMAAPVSTVDQTTTTAHALRPSVDRTVTAMWMSVLVILVSTELLVW